MKTTFHTDNARPCWRCSGTIATYTVDDAVTLIDVYCHGCHARDAFVANDHEPPLTTAAEISAAHRRTR